MFTAGTAASVVKSAGKLETNSDFRSSHETVFSAA